MTRETSVSNRPIPFRATPEWRIFVAISMNAMAFAAIKLVWVPKKIKFRRVCIICTNVTNGLLCSWEGAFGRYHSYSEHTQTPRNLNERQLRPPRCRIRRRRGTKEWSREKRTHTHTMCIGASNRCHGTKFASAIPSTMAKKASKIVDRKFQGHRQK